MNPQIRPALIVNVRKTKSPVANGAVNAHLEFVSLPPPM